MSRRRSDERHACAALCVQARRRAAGEARADDDGVESGACGHLGGGASSAPEPLQPDHRPLRAAARAPARCRAGARRRSCRRTPGSARCARRACPQVDALDLHRTARRGKPRRVDWPGHRATHPPAPGDLLAGRRAVRMIGLVEPQVREPLPRRTHELPAPRRGRAPAPASRVLPDHVVGDKVRHQPRRRGHSTRASSARRTHRDREPRSRQSTCRDATPPAPLNATPPCQHPPRRLTSAGCPVLAEGVAQTVPVPRAGLSDFWDARRTSVRVRSRGIRQELLVAAELCC